MGWDQAAVKEAAKDHMSNDQKEADAAGKKRKAELKMRETERARLYPFYLREAPRYQASPVGSYIVDCEEIEEQWPDQAKDMTIDIHPADEAGIFKAEFDFGVLNGVMILGADKGTVARYCSRVDESGDEDEDEDNSDSASDSDSTDLKGSGISTLGSKRKVPAPKRVKGPKKPKKTVVLTYQLGLRCRETGEGQIFSDPYDGTIKFKDGKFASFTCEANMPCVGAGVPFTARKVSKSPDSYGKEWADYSEQQYERARISRWH